MADKEDNRILSYLVVVQNSSKMTVVSLEGILRFLQIEP
jgi:hypothetical protein